MRKLRLLLLEDQEMDAAFIQKVLQRSGMNFEMVRVVSKADFLSAVQDFIYDVILADNYLPDFDALTALQLMKEYNVTTPLILVTGTASEEFAVNIMKAGACDYILKDRLQRLPNAVISAVKKHELEQEQQQYLESIIKNEALLKESERLAHMGSWEANLLTGETIWSDEIYRILDYSPGVLIPNLNNFLARVHPADIAVVQEEVNHALSSGTDVRLDCRILKNNGQIAYLENNLFVTKDEAGRPARAYGFSIDVTERKLAEELLQKSEANLKTIFDNTETGYALLDVDCRIVSFNQPIYRFSQQQLAQPIRNGELFLDFCLPERRAIVASFMSDALKGIASQYEVPYAQADGSDMWFYITSSPVTDEDGRVIGIIMSETDITKKKLLELQEKMITDDLLQRNKALEQFAYIVSHNLRGPMTTIMGIANLLNDKSLSDEDKTFFMNGITETVKKLDNVVMDLVSILQFKNNGSENREPVFFDQVINDVASVIKPAASSDRELTIKTDFSAVNSMVTLKSYIHSIFYNLISNSIKYKQPELAPHIEIASRRTDDKIELLFRDNGMGMDLDKMGDQVFGLYKRFHVNSAEGKGMGLFMVKTQVETLGGKISVKSRINEGTEFRIEFFSNN